MLATQQIAGNNSGAFLRTPRIVVMHATRSGQDWTDAEELGATLNWFVNPNGASSHWVISEKERVRVVQDSLIAWHSAYLNSRSWGIELTQPTDEDFTDGHYANVALIGQSYVKLGVAPVWLDYWDGGDASGFVDHADTIQGRQSGKSDAGPKFDRARFIASLQESTPEPEPIEEDDMKLYAGKPSGRVYIVGPAGKRHIPPLELSAHHKAGLKSIEMPDEEIAAIPDLTSGGGGDGLTREETIEANQEAARRGTG